MGIHEELVECEDIRVGQMVRHKSSRWSRSGIVRHIETGVATIERETKNGCGISVFEVWHCRIETLTKDIPTWRGYALPVVLSLMLIANVALVVVLWARR